MLRNGSKMAKNALNDPIFSVQALKTSYFLITNVIGPIQGGKSGKKKCKSSGTKDGVMLRQHSRLIFSKQ